MPLTYNTQQVLSWDELLESINNGASHPDETQWAIYRYLKENYKNEGSVMSRTLLAAYMKLHVNEPSLINSLMLGIAAKVSEVYPGRANTFYIHHLIQIVNNEHEPTSYA